MIITLSVLIEIRLVIMRIVIVNNFINYCDNNLKNNDIHIKNELMIIIFFINNHNNGKKKRKVL